MATAKVTTASSTRDVGALFQAPGLDEFRTQIYGKAWNVQRGESDLFGELLTWTALNRLLETQRLDPPRVRLASEGADIPLERYGEETENRHGRKIVHVSASALQSELRRGATLIIDAIDQMHPPIRRLAEGFEDAFGERAQVNAYASWTETRGFDLHWDDHDVFVFQVAGSKSWRLFGMSRRFPLHRDVDPNETPPAGPEWSGTVNAGDLLYIPRGFWHDARATNGPSLHLTLGISKATGVDLLRWLSDELRSDELFREDLPRFGNMESHESALLRRLEKEWTSNLGERFFASSRARRAPRLAFSLPWGALDEPLSEESAFTVRSLVESSGNELDGMIEDEQIRIPFDGRMWSFSLVAKPLLELILDGRPHQLEEVVLVGNEHQLSPEVVKEFIATLLHNGLVAVDEAPGLNGS